MIEKDYGYYYTLPQEQYERELKIWYKSVTGKELNLENPQTFNEKIQWLKLYDSTPLKTRLADKYLVREWVAERIGEEYLIPLLGVWDSFDEIDFDALPDQFVLKGNHGSGYNYIVKDKKLFDKADAKAKFDWWMREDFAFRNGLELHYHGIKPRIIAEKYIQNSGNDLYDYKVFCFNGKAESIMFLSDRKSKLKMAFYDTAWNKLPFVYDHIRNEDEIPCPCNLNLLLELSEKLAEGFPHVRVDFYRLDDGTYIFGELTFTSAGGRCKWNIPEQDKIYGDLIELPPKEKCKLRPMITLLENSNTTRIADKMGNLFNQRAEIQYLRNRDAANLLSIQNECNEMNELKGKSIDSSVLYNDTFRTANGDFVIFVDSESFFDEDRLLDAIRKIANQRADILILDARGGMSHDQGLYSAQELPSDVLEYAMMNLPQMIIRKSFIEQKKIEFEEMEIGCEHCFAMEALLQCERIAVYQNAVCRKEKVESDLNLQQPIHRYIGQLMDRLKTKLPEKSLNGVFSQRYADIVLGLCLFLLKSCRAEEYVRQYNMLKSCGFEELGLAKLEQGRFTNISRYRQLRAMLESDAVIRFV